MHDTARVKLLYLYAESYYNQNLKWYDLNRVREYAERGLTLSQAINYRYGVVRGWMILSNQYGSQNRIDKASEYAFRAKAEAEQLFPVLNYLEFLNGTLSFLYYKSGKYQEVVNNGKLVLETYQAKKLNNMGVFLLANYNIGNAYTELGQLDSARKYFGYVLPLYLKEQNQAGLGTTYTNMGEVEMRAGNLPLAKDYFEKGLAYAQKVSARSIAADALSNLSATYLKMGNTRAALAAAQEALQYAIPSMDRAEVLDAYYALKAGYNALGDFANAYKYQGLHHALQDSLRADIITYQVELSRQNFLLQQRDAQLKLLGQENRLRLTYVAAGSIGLILLLSIIFFNNRLSVRRRANRELMLSKMEVEQALSKLQRTQQQLIAAEKLASLGKLVANLAHELNSPMGAIKGSADYLKKELPYLENELQRFWNNLDAPGRALFETVLEMGRSNVPFEMSTREERFLRKQLQDQIAVVDHTQQQETAEAMFHAGVWDAAPLYAYLGMPLLKDVLYHAARVQGIRNGVNNILLSIERTNKVVVALRLFQKDNLERPTDILSIRELLQKCLEAFRHVFRHEVRLHAELGGSEDPEPLVCGHADELMQLWVQLVSNAVQAVGTQGDVILKLQHNQGRVQVHITDTGAAIPPQVLSEIFEPFFTTQQVGHGSGLGLFVAKKIAEKHGGDVSAQSEPGRTTFTVTLPLAAVLPNEAPGELAKTT